MSDVIWMSLGPPCSYWSKRAVVCFEGLFLAVTALEMAPPSFLQ